MNSKERKELRYKRRKEKRNKKCHDITFYDVFTYTNLFNSAKRCFKGVNWKTSTKTFRFNITTNIYELLVDLRNDTYKSKGFKEFTIIERGKKRNIKSVHISERVIQKNICNHVLIPILTPSLIYDNGACLKRKGYSFSVNRMETHLRRYFRKYGNTGYVLLFDFSKYFDRIDHEKVKQMLKDKIKNEKTYSLICSFIDNFGDAGLGLGSEISQILAVYYPNKLDHYIKEVLKIKGYGRYMDDGYLIHQDKQYLKYCLSEISKICNSLGIVINTKKTRIVPINKYFTYLKIKFYVTDTGKVIKKVGIKSRVRMSRKLKKFKKKYDNKILTKIDIISSYLSWKAYYSQGNNYLSTKRMDKYFINLFKFYPKI